MAVTSGSVQINIRISGENTAGRAMQEAGAGLASLDAKAASVGTGLSVNVDQASQGFLGLGDGIQASVAKLGVLKAGADAALGALASIGEFVGEAAGRADRFDILNAQVADLEGLIDSVREKSAGMIPRAAIVQAAAMFKSFGLDVNQLDRALGQAAETAVRTGEGVERLTDSLVLGIARESPAILDNLGIVVSLEEAKLRAAEATGKLAEELTAEERKAGLLSLTLEKLEKNNINVNLTNTRTASVERLGVAWDDFTDGAGEFLADAAVGIIDFFVKAEEETDSFGRQLSQVRKELPAFVNDVIDAAEASFNTLDRTAARTIGRFKELLALQRRAGETTTKTDEDRVTAAAKAAEAQVLAEGVQEQVRVATALERNKALFDNDEDFKKRRLNSLQGEIQERAKAAGDAAAAAETQAILSDKAQGRREKAEREQLEIGISLSEEGIARTKGATQAQLELAEVKTEIATLDKANLSDLRKIDKLKQSELALESTIRNEREASRGGGGGRRRAAVAEEDPIDRTVTALIAAHQLEIARLRTNIQLSEEQQKELARQRLFLEVETSRTQLIEGRLTIEEFENKQRISTLRFSARFLQIEQRITDEKFRQADAEHERIQAQRQSLGLDQVDQLDVVQQALTDGAITEQEALALREAEILDRRIEKYAEFSEALQRSAAAAADSQNDVVSALGRMTQAVDANLEVLIRGGPAAIAAGGRVASGLIKNKKAQAGIEGAFELAAAVASAARLDFFGATQHGIAAGLFFAVAGGGGGAGGGRAGAGGGGAPRAQARTDSDRGERQGATVLIFNSPVVMGTTPQEAGAQLGRLSTAADGTGMG